MSLEQRSRGRSPVTQARRRGPGGRLSGRGACRTARRPRRGSVRPAPAGGPGGGRRRQGGRPSRRPPGRPSWRPSPARWACAGSTSWPGGTSTTPRPAAPSSTPTGSPACGPRPGIDVTFRTSAVPGASRAGRPRRLPGRPQVGPLRRLPGRRGGGAGRRAAAGRGAGRGLERHAVLLAPVVPGAADRLPAPRPRRDVADGAARLAGPAGRDRRAAGGPPALPAQPGGHPLAVVQARRS